MKEFFEVDETEINSLEKINGIDYFSSSFLWNGKEVPDAAYIVPGTGAVVPLKAN